MKLADASELSCDAMRRRASATRNRPPFSRRADADVADECRDCWAASSS